MVHLRSGLKYLEPTRIEDDTRRRPTSVRAGSIFLNGDNMHYIFYAHYDDPNHVYRFLIPKDNNGDPIVEIYPCGNGILMFTIYIGEGGIPNSYSVRFKEVPVSDDDEFGSDIAARMAHDFE